VNTGHTPPPLGIAHFTVIEVPPVALVSLAARIGYAAIGLRLHPAFPGAPTYEIPLGSAVMHEMRRRLDGEGVRVHDIEFVTIDAGFDPLRLAPMLESASELGARRLSVCGDDPDRSRLVASFAALCDLAAQFDLGVDLECMAWRQVASLPDAVQVVADAGQPNGGALVDAIHLSRTGGSPRDLDGVPAGMVRHVQLCDASAARPTTTEAIIQEARSGRLLPGQGALPLHELLAAVPDGAALSVEVPVGAGSDPEAHARRVYEATRTLLDEHLRAREAKAQH
jgi:sugar phosphate isomerase/epimerase